MARSPLSIQRHCALALAVTLAASGQDDNSDELQFTSLGPFVLDGPTNMMRAQQPRITQGNLLITADEVLATGFELDQAGEFRFTGNVRIEVEYASMQAKSAIFMYANGRLSRGELVGAPVSFSDVDATTRRMVTGSADKMSYDYVARTLQMTGNASVQIDTREVMGCDLIYDFRAERVTSGSADCEDKFRVRIRRDAQAEAAPDPPQ